jgi:hypothetical protein
MRAGTAMRVRRMVPVVALASCGRVKVAVARVRLNAIPASTSRAASAVNRRLVHRVRATTNSSSRPTAAFSAS